MFGVLRGEKEPTLIVWSTDPVAKTFILLGSLLDASPFTFSIPPLAPTALPQVMDVTK